MVKDEWFSGWGPVRMDGISERTKGFGVGYGTNAPDVEIALRGQAKKMRDDAVRGEEIVKIGILRGWDTEVRRTFRLGWTEIG